MKLTAYDVNKINKPFGYRQPKHLELIEEFTNSGMNCAKVEGWTQKNAFVCAGSLNKSIERFNKAGIRAISRNGEVFLVKTE